jgi:hypothetical protein
MHRLWPAPQAGVVGLHAFHCDTAIATINNRDLWFSAAQNLRLFQHEITAIPELLDALLLKGAIVTIDAM